MTRRDAPSASLLSQLPWLLDANSWALALAPGAEPPGGASGVWPLGNGKVFAHAGAAPPVSRLSGIVGPRYHHLPFGDCWLQLVAQQGDVTLPYQEIWRPRQSGVLVTRAHDRAVSLLTIDYAPPGHGVVLRLVEIWQGDRLGGDARLVVHLPGGEPYESRRRSLRLATAQGVLLLSALAPGRLASPGRLDLPLTDVASSGGVRRAVLVLATGTDEAEAFSGLPQVLHPMTLLDQTRASWHVWLGRTLTPDLWPQNFPGPSSTAHSMADLIEAGKLALKMQLAFPSGALAGMAACQAASARATLGPVRALLAMGAREEVGDLLEYQYRSAVILGRVPDTAPTDLSTAGAGELSDWSPVPVPSANTGASVILPHRWWLESGGDSGLVRRHWRYLRRCALGHTVTAEGLLAPHGGESHPCAVLETLFPERCGWPNALVALGTGGQGGPWLLDTMAAYVAAQEAMAWMAERIGHADQSGEHLGEAARVRGAIERLFWLPQRGHYAPAVYSLSRTAHEAPCVPLNLLPLWLRYHPADTDQARRNLQAVVDLVGFRASTPDCEHFLGPVPGQLAWSLASVGSDLAPLALANLVALASPAGGWADLYGPGATGGDLGPCEVGVSLDAIYRYYSLRDAATEPTSDLRGVTRDGKTYGPGPVQRFQPSPPRDPLGIVVVSADRGDLRSAHRRAGVSPGEPITVIEPGLPFGASFFHELLFDPATGRRRVHVLVLGESALAGDRRSMKPVTFWQAPEIVRAWERFQADGGRLVLPA